MLPGKFSPLQQAQQKLRLRHRTIVTTALRKSRQWLKNYFAIPMLF